MNISSKWINLGLIGLIGSGLLACSDSNPTPTGGGGPGVGAVGNCANTIPGGAILGQGTAQFNGGTLTLYVFNVNGTTQAVGQYNIPDINALYFSGNSSVGQTTTGGPRVGCLQASNVQVQQQSPYINISGVLNGGNIQFQLGNSSRPADISAANLQGPIAVNTPEYGVFVISQ